MPEPTMREAAAADAGEIAALAARAWRAAYADILTPGRLAGLDSPEREAEWRAYLGSKPAGDRMWLIVSDRAIRGFARTGPSPDPDLPARAGEVHGLYVDPDRIGTGHGRRLFVHALADLVVRDLRPVVVWHFAANDRAARFYERAGLPLDGGRRMSEFGVEELRRRRG